MKRILDEKTKRILSGMLPFSPNSFVEWTPKEFLDLPAELQPSFNIRPFDKATIESLRKDGRDNKFGIDTARMTLKYAMTSWKNVFDLGTSEDIEFSQDAIDLLPESLTWLIYKKCNEMTFGISDEEKQGLELQQRAESASLNKAAENADLVPA